MQIIEIPIDKLVPDPNNARTHDEKNLNAIKGSLAKFGQQYPIVIDEKNVVLAGNGRLEGAKSLGWGSVKCVVSDLKTATEKAAFKIADNRSGELASWDDATLGKELQSLREDGFDIEDIGFEVGELGLDSEENEMENLMDGFNENGSGDRQEPELKTCPNCGVTIDS